MKIAIIGSGSVAQTLAGGMLKHGHAVQMATRDQAKLADFVKANPGVTVTDSKSAAAWADLAILSVKGTAALAALAPAADALAGKIVIDTTNPIADEAPDNGVLRYFTSGNDSLGERLQAAYPSMRFVKAFNSVGAGMMVNPSIAGGPPTMFIAGNDAGAKETVGSILTTFGWEPLDMGQIEASRAIEALCQLWCLPGFIRNDWAHALKWLKV